MNRELPELPYRLFLSFPHHLDNLHHFLEYDRLTCRHFSSEDLGMLTWGGCR